MSAPFFVYHLRRLSNINKPRKCRSSLRLILMAFLSHLDFIIRMMPPSGSLFLQHLLTDWLVKLFILNFGNLSVQSVKSRMIWLFSANWLSLPKTIVPLLSDYGLFTDQKPCLYRPKTASLLCKGTIVGEQA